MFMNKYLLLSLFSVMPFAQTGNTTKSTILLNERFEVLNGRVKQLIETSVSLRGSPLLQLHNDTLIFDKKGNQANPDGTFKYNAILKVNEGNESEAKFSVGLYTKAVYRIDNNGNVVQALYYNKDGFYERTVYTFGPGGRVSQQQTYDKLSVLFRIVKYDYDKDGNMVKQCNY